jgi:hypothetical protein
VWGFRNALFPGLFRPFPERSRHVVVPRMHMTIAIPSHLSDSTRAARWRSCVAQVKPRAVTAGARRVVDDSRHVAAEVRRVVWVRDGGRGAFLAASGHRCSERAFLNTTTSRPARSAVKRRSRTSSCGVARTTDTRRTGSSEPIAGTVGPMGWPSVGRSTLFPGVSRPFRNGRNRSIALHVHRTRPDERPGDSPGY